MTDLRPALAPIFGAFGVSAVVTIPGGAPVAATVIVGPRALPFPADPHHGDVALMEPIQRIAVRRSEIPILPRQSTIIVGVTIYLVEGVESEDDQVVRVKVR